MTIFLTIFWVVFGIAYIAWNAHKVCPCSVLICTGVVGGVISVFLLLRLVIEGAFYIHEAFAVIIVIALVIFGCGVIGKIIAKMYKDSEQDRIVKEIVSDLDKQIPTDAEIEEAILDIYFDSFYRTEEVKRMTFLNPDSSMYYKKSPITKMKAIRNWKRIQIQRRLDQINKE